MQSILDAINEWIKGILIGAINGNLSTMFGDVNEKVGTIANEVRQDPAGVEREYLLHDTEPFGECNRPHSGACHYLCPMRGAYQHGNGKKQSA